MLSTTDLTNLATARSSYVSQLVSLAANPKPSYSVNGQSFSWTEYQRFLTEQVKAIDDLISANEDPFEEVSLGYN